MKSGGLNGQDLCGLTGKEVPFLRELHTVWRYWNRKSPEPKGIWIQAEGVAIVQPSGINRMKFPEIVAGVAG